VIGWWLMVALLAVFAVGGLVMEWMWGDDDRPER
jgi:hypothetical protein